MAKSRSAVRRAPPFIDPPGYARHRPEETRRIEAQPFLPKQRLYIASDTEVFTATSPSLTLETDANGRPVSIEVGFGVVAGRKTE